MFITHRFHFPQVDSTQLWAFRELEAGKLSEEPTLLSASEQLAGKGQKEHSWFSPAGCLMFSLLFTPARFQIPLSQTPMLGLVFGLALFETTRKILPDEMGQRLAIHWPNDLYIRTEGGGFRKLAGILLEGHASGTMVAGVGVNLLNSSNDAPDEVRNRLVSMNDLFSDWPNAAVLKSVEPLPNPGFPEPMERFLALFLEELERKLDGMVHPLFLNEVVRKIEKNCIQCGTNISLETPQGTISGFCNGLEEDGAILIDGRKFYSGIVNY